jgi:alkylation response protein AidB-like acyl-CoA dehydrogenase
VNPVDPASPGAGSGRTAEAAARFAAAVRDDAAAWDADGGLPAAVRKEAAAAGLLAADLPEQYGGSAVTPAELGEICAHLGGVCSALRGLVTVQGMVAAALHRWGTKEQRARWLPSLASGDRLAGFAATEDGAGSALAGVATRIEDAGDGGAGGSDGGYVTVTGRKKWVTFGQDADLLLVLGRYGGRPAAVVVDCAREGVHREPVTGQLGMRAARVAHVELAGVRVPRADLVAPAGLGLSHVAAAALDHGRFTVAWGCVGTAEACVADATAHAASRTQAAGADEETMPLAGHQSVRALLARAAVETAGARELALRAARFRQDGATGAMTETIIAKYAAASAAAHASSTAVQILGSYGCEEGSRAGRHFRDAKVMEIIEGAQQVAELHIAEQLLRRHAPAAAPARTGGVRA